VLKSVPPSFPYTYDLLILVISLHTYIQCICDLKRIDIQEGTGYVVVRDSGSQVDTKNLTFFMKPLPP